MKQLETVKYNFSTIFIPGKNSGFCVDGFFCEKEPHMLEYSILLNGKKLSCEIEKKPIEELASFSPAYIDANIHITGECTAEEFFQLILVVKDSVTKQEWSFSVLAFCDKLTNLKYQFFQIKRTFNYLKKHGVTQTIHRIKDFLLPRMPYINSPKIERSSYIPPEQSRYLNGRVLIIGEMSLPQCKYYRVLQKAEMLKQAGIEFDIADWRNHFDCMQYLQVASLVIFYRVPYFQNVAEYYDEARKLGLRIGFDVDDLIFDMEAIKKNKVTQECSEKDRQGLLAGVYLYLTALQAADFTIASTITLQKFMQKYHPVPSYLIPNALQKKEFSEKSVFKLGRANEIVIGYGAGSNTHNWDFLECSDALFDILKDFPQVSLALHGELKLAKKFDQFKNRIHRVAFVPFAEYTQVIQRFDINLIPLEKNIFNDCKSNIKYIEASALSIPSVASPREEFIHVIKNGINGFLAENKTQWYNALKELVLSAELRKKMGKNAFRTVMTKYSTQTIYSRYFEKILKDQCPIPPRKKKRIAVVNLLYAPYSFGGATILTEQIVDEYKKYAEPVVFSANFHTLPHWPGYVERNSIHDVPVFCYEFSVSSDPVANFSNQQCANAFDFFLAHVKPDIVHFNSIQMMGVEMLEVCQRKHIPYFVTAHDAWWICENQFMLDSQKHFCGQDKDGIDLYRCVECTHSKVLFPRWKKLFTALNQAEFILTPSDFQRDLYIKCGFPAKKTHTNRNGIIIPQNVSPHRLHETLTFAYLGGKCDHKGYYFLKEIMKKIHGNYKLKLVDIDLKFGLKRISEKEWPVPRKVECCEPFDYQTLDDFYSQIDVLLFPSCWKESFGLTIREALVRNIWVIATDAGGDISYDLHDGENGNLCALYDQQAFAESIQNLIDHPEKLSGFENPYRNQIRSVDVQVEEINDFLKLKNDI